MKEAVHACLFFHAKSAKSGSFLGFLELIAGHSMTKEKAEKLPRKSGYAEPHPLTNDRKKKDPDANTPHEPQNVPERKPLPSSR
jgi:hypothetical protein